MRPISPAQNVSDFPEFRKHLILLRSKIQQNLWHKSWSCTLLYKVFLVVEPGEVVRKFCPMHSLVFVAGTPVTKNGGHVRTYKLG